MKVHVCHVVYTSVVYVFCKFNTSIVHLLIHFQQGNISVGEGGAGGVALVDSKMQTA